MKNKLLKRIFGIMLLSISTCGWIGGGLYFLGIGKIIMILTIIGCIFSTVIGFGLTFCNNQGGKSKSNNVKIKDYLNG